VKAVFTNTVPVDAYRGAGRPEATFLIERLVDVAAKQCGFDKLKLRRRNFIPTDAFPYQTPVALQYDSGDYFSTLDQALATAGLASFEAAREAPPAGSCAASASAPTSEACGIAPRRGRQPRRAPASTRVGTIRVTRPGSVTVLTGAHSHGQGHETTSRSSSPTSSACRWPGGRRPRRHRQGPLRHGHLLAAGSLAVGGSAMDKAMDKIISQGKRIAAHLMEASVEDVEFDRGAPFRGRPAPTRSSSSPRSASRLRPAQLPPSTSWSPAGGTAFYDPKNFTYPGGCHIARSRSSRTPARSTW
jgi:carbon-monoxide dehydrogenase large subunit